MQKMEFTFWFGVLFIVAAILVALFAGDKFVNAYLKGFGGENLFYYRRWKYCFVLYLLLTGIGFLFRSSIVGPILLIIAIVIWPILTFTWCSKKQQ